MKLSNLKFENSSQILSIILVILIFLSACSKKTTTPSQTVEKRLAPSSIDVKKALQFPEDRLIDVLHTELELSFNWKEQMVIGQATLTIRPYIDDINGFYLDAKSMEIKDLILSGDSIGDITYSYDGKRINFKSDIPLKKADVFTVEIDYQTVPANYYDSLSPENKGLYFINPLDTIPWLMPQIWTQGESEFNSIWFPCLDRPDEKYTQEILLTVDTAYTTLSNGILISKIFNDDGTRTDYWKQDKPHSTYLTMIAVGDWEVVELESESIPLYIYSEKEYAESIKAVFANTNEMIRFFSELFDYPFPWGKYAQIPVRRFVTGAMENTGASVFSEDLYVDEKYLVDENFDWIISHELIHQWFGDLVTAESWSYISLNEGIANYAEYLWAEYKYGEEEAGLVRLGEIDQYFTEAQQYRAPIIRYRYNHPDEMFDAHSYSKGGLVLHMLRNELGDETFFRSLSQYLKIHQYQNVELSDLRQVFEEESGKDLKLFFLQWFEKPGHPELDIRYSRQGDTAIFVEIEQIQRTDELIFPLEFSYLIDKNKSIDTIINIVARQNSFIWQLPETSGVLIPNPGNTLLADISIDKTYEELLLQYRNTDDFLNRYGAFKTLIDSFPDRVNNSGLYQEFLGDKYYTIQELALDFIERNNDVLLSNTRNKMVELARESKKSYVRAAALSSLYMLGENDTIFYKEFLNDSSWYVNAMALDALMELKKDRDEMLNIVDYFSASYNPHIVNSVASYYISLEEDYSDWFIEKTARLNEQDKYAILGYYGLGISGADSATQKKGIDFLYHTAMNDEFEFNRIMAYQSLLVFVDRPEVKEMLIEILDKEGSEGIKSWFSSMLK